MYISKDISYVLQRDLQKCSSRELESIFTEITIPNKSSSLLGTIFKHPLVKPYKFNNEFLEPLLSKIEAEDKATFLAGDFNFNFIKCNQIRALQSFQNAFSQTVLLRISLSPRDLFNFNIVNTNRKYLLNNQLEI